MSPKDTNIALLVEKALSKSKEIEEQSNRQKSYIDLLSQTTAPNKYITTIHDCNDFTTLIIYNTHLLEMKKEPVESIRKLDIQVQEFKFTISPKYEDKVKPKNSLIYIIENGNAIRVEENVLSNPFIKNMHNYMKKNKTSLGYELAFDNMFDKYISDKPKL